ncbi:UbiA family prenyltransferase [Hymenobacter sp. BT523]|uniref:UbiA family prenyltransferase n=1 Tax=Hymenobacter sp. BT523 TaxID=2795725 RepID=UPI0018EDD2A7|nr:UbiA family prenyltransferase [Hymenobacter sp. BT523]MBJ6107807.1 UbiA family prenyltransferase [Hymenobacter sp. BT523]
MALISAVLTPPAPSLRFSWPRRLLDAVLYSSVWLSGAAAAQTAYTLHLWPPLDGAGYRLVLLVFAATLLVYNLDAALPFKHRQPAGTSGRKAWQQRHRRGLALLAAGAALVTGGLFLADGWWRYLPKLLPLAALALLYSWPLLRWRGRRRALREVPLLKVFLIAGVWSLVTVGLPALLLHHPLTAVAGLLALRFCLVLALAIVFDIRDVSRDRAAGTHTFPVLLGLRGAKLVALAFLAATLVLGLGWGMPRLGLLFTVLLAATVIVLAHERRDDYFFALLADGVLLVPPILYFLS